MAKKRILGSDFKRFYLDDEYWECVFGAEAYHEDLSLVVDGVKLGEDEIDTDKLPDSALVEICSGYITTAGGKGDDCVAFSSAYNTWQKKQTCITVVIQCGSVDRALVTAEVADAVKRVGAKVL